MTVYYNASQAPSFRSQISSAASIWNSSESNVKLQEASSGADFSYYEGNDPRGSYASTDGHGSWLRLPRLHPEPAVRLGPRRHPRDRARTGPELHDYNGLCSELMSGGSAGPSCTNLLSRHRALACRPAVGHRTRAGPGHGDRPADHLSAAPPRRAWSGSGHIGARGARQPVPTTEPPRWPGTSSCPLTDGVAHVVLDVFAPHNPAEFHRVLRPTGQSIVVRPTGRHLVELRGRLPWSNLIDLTEEQRLHRALDPFFEAAVTAQVEHAVTLTRLGAPDLVAMTPSARHVSHADLNDDGFPRACVC